MEKKEIVVVCFLLLSIFLVIFSLINLNKAVHLTKESTINNTCSVGFSEWNNTISELHYSEQISYKDSSYRVGIVNNSDYYATWLNYNQSETGFKVECSLNLNKCRVVVVDLSCLKAWNVSKEYTCSQEYMLEGNFSKKEV